MILALIKLWIRHGPRHQHPARGGEWWVFGDKKWSNFWKSWWRREKVTCFFVSLLLHLALELLTGTSVVRWMGLQCPVGLGVKRWGVLHGNVMKSTLRWHHFAWNSCNYSKVRKFLGMQKSSKCWMTSLWICRLPSGCCVCELGEAGSSLLVLWME